MCIRLQDANTCLFIGSLNVEFKNKINYNVCLGAGNGGGVVVGGVSAAGGTSEYVRNELRAVVGARSRPDLHQQMQPDLDPLITFDMSTPGQYFTISPCF